MNTRRFVVLVVIAVVVMFVFPTVMYSEKKENEAGKDAVQEHDKKNAPETTTKLPKKIINSIGMEFVYIPPTGDKGFMMGSALSPGEVVKRYGGEAWWYELERPQHKVVLTKAFYLQTTEVTQKQWKALMDKNPSSLKGDDLPVHFVSWNDTQDFIKKLNKKEGTNKYRLPTEAEWEYACRAGTTTVYYWGNEVDDEYCWYKDNSDEKVHSVGKKKPNAWCLHDMNGNVLEWCQDWADKDYYRNSPEKDPQGPNKGKARVYRGGSRDSSVWTCRSANRFWGPPGLTHRNVGLRLLYEAD